MNLDLAQSEMTLLSSLIAFKELFQTIAIEGIYHMIVSNVWSMPYAC